MKILVAIVVIIVGLMAAHNYMKTGEIGFNTSQSEEERELLDVAACWGYEFDPRLVGNVVGVRAIPLLRMLARITDRLL